MQSHSSHIALIRASLKHLGFNAAASQAEWIYRNGDLKFIAPALRKAIEGA